MSDSVIPMVCTQVAESLLSIFTIGPPSLRDEAFQLMNVQNSSEFARDVEIAIHKFFKGNSRKSPSMGLSYPVSSVASLTQIDLFSENDLFSDSSISAFSDDEFSPNESDIASTILPTYQSSLFSPSRVSKSSPNWSQEENQPLVSYVEWSQESD